MKIDWQAFEAGVLSSEESAEARRLLETDPAARAEYEGFLRFREQLRLAGQSVEVPLASLRDKVTVREKPRKWNVPLVAAAAVLVFFGILAASLVVRDSDPVAVHSTRVTSPKEATAFLRDRSEFDLPVFDPTPVASLVSVSCNKYWAKYEMAVKGNPVSLIVTKAGKRLFRAGMVKRGTHKFFVQESQGLATIIWRDGAFEFTFFGLKLADSWPVVDDFAAKTAAWVADPGTRNGPTVGDTRQH